MPINQEVTATFSEAMDPATITGSTFTVIGPGLTPVTGNVSYDAANGIAIFAPIGTFAASTEFTATIMTGAKSLGALRWRLTSCGTSRPVRALTRPTRG
jgi:Bacterial Ig-like domain